ncbi:MAG TPA: CaiB/BaiF CoA-transferase family protein [Candidatus Binataceae bacterium]
MLSPYQVLDLTNERGLLCGQILGDLGADVIKIEPPGGSRARSFGPFLDDRQGPEKSLYWWAFNRNKRSITLNLDKPEGRTILEQLASKAHFLIESETPGEMAARALGYENLASLNPALVYVSISPFGQDGPKARYADADLVVLAAGGPLIIGGDEDRAPVRVSVPQAYLHASAEAAMAALIAHRERQRSGRGQHVDVSAQQAVAQATQSYILSVPLESDQIQRMSGGVKVGPLKVQLVWQVRDGNVAVVFLFGSAIGPYTRRLMEIVHAEGYCDEATLNKDWLRYTELMLSGQEPLAEYERLKGIVGQFLAGKTKTELLELALKCGLLIAPVTTIEEVVNSPQLAARGFWTEVHHPEVGRTIRYAGPFAKFSRSPIRQRRRPPMIGEHNREIYFQLGYSDPQLESMQRRGVI